MSSLTSKVFFRKNSVEIQNALQKKKYKTAKNLLNVGFTNIVQECERELKQYFKKIDEIIRSRRKLYLLITTLEKECKIQKSILEEQIAIERQNQKEIFESDKYEKQKDDFIVLINEKISHLDNSVLAFTQQINKKVNNRAIPQPNFIDEQFKNLQNLLVQARKEVQQVSSANSKKYKNFISQVDSSLTLWNGFISSFENRLTSLKDEILDDVVRIAFIVHTTKHSTNQIDLDVKPSI